MSETKADSGNWTYRTWVECPRPWGIVPAISRSCINLGLKLDIEAHDKGWFREYVAFKVAGPKNSIEILRQWIRSL